MTVLERATITNMGAELGVTTFMKSKGGIGMREYVKIPAVYMRRGTSKGAYLMVEDLPVDSVFRDKALHLLD